MDDVGPDLVEQLCRIAATVADPVLPCDPRGGVSIGVAAADDLHSTEAAQGREMSVGDVTTADDADS